MSLCRDILQQLALSSSILPPTRTWHTSVAGSNVDIASLYSSWTQKLCRRKAEPSLLFKYGVFRCPAPVMCLVASLCALSGLPTLAITAAKHTNGDCKGGAQEARSSSPGEISVTKDTTATSAGPRVYDRSKVYGPLQSAESASPRN